MWFIYLPLKLFNGKFEEESKEKMRNLRHISIVHSDGCKCEQKNTCIDLKKWLNQANSDDLHALYTGEVENNTPYQFHDLLFTLHYADKSARYYRNELITNFRELVSGKITEEEIRERAATLNAVL